MINTITALNTLNAQYIAYITLYMRNGNFDTSKFYDFILLFKTNELSY